MPKPNPSRAKSKENTEVEYGSPYKPDLTPEQIERYKLDLKVYAERKNKTLRAAYKRDGMKIRTDILHASLHIENTVKGLLMQLLDIPEDKEIGSRLTFDQQITFLLAYGAFDPQDRKFIGVFKDVRNKFIHHLEINTYTACYEKIGQREFIMKLVEEDTDKRPYNVKGIEEETLAWGTNLLIQKVVVICDQVDEFVLNATGQRLTNGWYAEATHRFEKTVRLESGPFGMWWAKLMKEQDKPYSAVEVAEIIKAVSDGVMHTYRGILNEVREEYFRETDKDS